MDLSSLWSNPEERFILRFRDLSEEKKISLSKRIKATAPYYRIKSTRGPSVEEIQTTLMEFNPVIFAEYNGNNTNSYRNFAIYSVYSMTSYCYKKICSAIYYLICLKRPMREEEIEKIISTTTIDWNITTNFMNDNYRGEDRSITPEPERINIPEIGMEEITNIRLRTEHEGSGRIPRAMREEEGTSFGIGEDLLRYVDTRRRINENRDALGSFAYSITPNPTTEEIDNSIEALLAENDENTLEEN
jgi:hypothetical protein